jgi:hypothetical protein
MARMLSEWLAMVAFSAVQPAASAHSKKDV